MADAVRQPGRRRAGAASDVEALRLSTEQHAVEKEWLWLMLTAVDDPVVLTDANNDIILHNLRAEKIFRANPED